jgi:Ca2+-binding EF-hand superfamily protein
MLFFGAFSDPDPPANFRTLDLKADGRVTFQELSDYYARHIDGWFQVQQGNTPNPSAAVLNAALIRLLDTDKDGMLSKKELALARETLPRRDLNEDELVTTSELGSTPYQATSPYVYSEVLSSRGSSSDNGMLLAVTPGYVLTRLNNQLLARYSTPNAKTKGPKSEVNVPLDKMFLARLDTNKDGQLDAKEWAQFVSGPPDLELKVQLRRGDSRTDLTAVTELPVTLAGTKEQSGLLATRARKRSDGGLTVDVGNVRLELEGGIAEEEVARPGTFRQFITQEFKAADTDQNGYLELKEVGRNLPLRNPFKAMDADGDGKLYEKELLAYVAKLEELQSKVQGSRVELMVTGGQGLFELLDASRDGWLSPRELLNAPALLKELDRDGDGRLASNEIIRSYRLSFTSSPGRADPRTVVAVTTRVSVQFEYEVGPLWFHKMDRNGDGDVSEREFLGTRAMFRRIDTDGDGLISVGEAKRAEASSQQPD